MTHKLPELDFAADALAPFLTAETLSFHHGKHHDGYVKKLNKAIEGGPLASASLVELVKKSDGGVFNNAAQHYNHSFYWRCIAPGGAKEPTGDLKKAIESSFGSLKDLHDAFTSGAAKHFGSGWAWLTADSGGKLHVRTTSDAGCPLTDGENPLLTCDVWEHAYYIDYRNERPRYVDAFWKAINWNFVTLALAKPGDVEKAILGK